MIKGWVIKADSMYVRAIDAIAGEIILTQKSEHAAHYNLKEEATTLKDRYPALQTFNVKYHSITTLRSIR